MKRRVSGRKGKVINISRFYVPEHSRNQMWHSSFSSAPLPLDRLLQVMPTVFLCSHLLTVCFTELPTKLLVWPTYLPTRPFLPVRLFWRRSVDVVVTHLIIHLSLSKVQYNCVM